MKNVIKQVVFAVRAFRHCFPLALEQAKQADLKSNGKSSFPELVESGERFYPEFPTAEVKMETQSQNLGTIRDIAKLGMDT